MCSKHKDNSDTLEGSKHYISILLNFKDKVKFPETSVTKVLERGLLVFHTEVYI